MNGFADWLAATAQMQQAMQGLQAQFRLSEHEMREATDALAPAFLLGLRRLQANQAAFADMMAKVSLLPADSRAAGSTAMKGLFGPAGLADAVARQASMVSGLAPDTLMKMMPTLSAMTLEAFMHNAGGRPDRQPLPSDTAGVWMAEVMRRSANAMEAFSRPSGRDAAPDPAAAMTRLFSDAFKGFPWPFAMDAAESPQTARAEEATPQPAPTAERQRTPMDMAFDMMASGREMQAGYWRDMMAVFERHPPSRRPGKSR